MLTRREKLEYIEHLENESQEKTALEVLAVIKDQIKFGVL